MEEEKNQKQLDFTTLVKKLWPYRKTYYIVLPTTLIVTYLLMVCIPRFYRCTVSLAPEADSGSGGTLSSIASQFGLGDAFGKMSSNDAISAEIYPDVLASHNFIAQLMTTEITTKDGEVKCNYYTYLRDKQKAAWWNVILVKVMELFKPTPPDSYNGKETLSVFNLTKRQKDLFDLAQSNIKCVVDKKTDVVAITFKDQDPRVCAIMADATCQKLQEFIIDYRTNKARIDCEYYEKLCKDSEKEYQEALRAYAEYSDAHTSTIMTTYQAKQESLENEMQAKYNVYTAMSTQRQSAYAKLQEATPAFTVIQSASIPVKPAGPKRMIISIAMMMLSFIVLSGWLLVKKS